MSGVNEEERDLTSGRVKSDGDVVPGKRVGDGLEVVRARAAGGEADFRVWTLGQAQGHRRLVALPRISIAVSGAADNGQATEASRSLTPKQPC